MNLKKILTPKQIEICTKEKYYYQHIGVKKNLIQIAIEHNFIQKKLHINATFLLDSSLNNCSGKQYLNKTAILLKFQTIWAKKCRIPLTQKMIYILQNLQNG